MHRRPLVLVLILLLLAAGVWWWWPRGGEHPITNARPSGTTIIAFGDSLTAGAGVNRDEAYPAQLARRLGRPVLNRGISGQTTADALQRLERDVLATDPAIVLVLLGGNDMLRKVPRDEAMTNLRAIVERVQGRGALVVLMGLEMPLSGSWSEDYEALARATGCPYVPNVLRGILGDHDLTTDGIHPNAEGYRLMVERILPVVEPYVEGLSVIAGREEMAE